MTDRPPQQIVLTPAQIKRRRQRSIAMAIALAIVVVLFYAVSFVKGPGVGNTGM